PRPLRRSPSVSVPFRASASGSRPLSAGLVSANIVSGLDVSNVAVLALCYEIRSLRMAKKARKRAPGGGRKSLTPDGSDVVMLRIEPDLLKKVERLVAKRRGLAKHHGQRAEKWDRSKEIRNALRFWVSLHRQDTLHVQELASLIEMLVHDIE